MIGVLPGAPASEAGVLQDDVILEIDSTPVRTPDDVRSLLSARTVDPPLSLRVMRSDQERTLSVRLIPMPSSPRSAQAYWRGRTLPWSSEAATPWPSHRCQVLVLWASWCAACRVSEELLARWHDLALPGRPSLLVLNDQPRAEMERALRRGSPLVPGDVLTLSEGTLAHQWFVSVLPTWILLAPGGEVLSTLAGARELDLLRAQLEEANRRGLCPGPTQEERPSEDHGLRQGPTGTTQSRSPRLSPGTRPRSPRRKVRSPSRRATATGHWFNRLLAPQGTSMPRRVVTSSRETASPVARHRP